MNELAARKQALLAQAELHRQLFAFERQHLREQGGKAREFLAGNRWWLLGGAAAGGLLLTRRWRGLAEWLPTIVAGLRALRR